MQDLTNKAVQALLDANWEEAVELNSIILQDNPRNIPALNRLGRAYTELDQKDSAFDVYNKVLKLDKFNPIATRCLRLLPDKVGHCDVELSGEDFIDQAGLTKSTSLIKLASKEILLALKYKQVLTLVPRKRLVYILTETSVQLGALPDDLSFKLGKLMKTGYSYAACVKSATDNTLTIFIREIKRPTRLTASPSFAHSLQIKNLKK